MGLKELFESLRRRPVFDEKAAQEVIRELQRALIEADVRVEIVRDIVKRLRKKLREKPEYVSLRSYILKALYEELVRILGEKHYPLNIVPGKTNVLMLVGIQGSGKTTTAAKLAYYLSKRGYSVGLVCADTYRPGAYEQLKQLVEPYGIEVFGMPEEKDAVKIAKKGVEYFKSKGVDVVIVDTAGRHKEERGLIEEMKKISEAIKPDEILLVIDGTIGQAAYDQAKAFAEATPIGSIIITKLDGSAKGGGAISAAVATGAKVKFIGVGEKINDLEEYDPGKFVARLVGIPDIRDIAESVTRAIEEASAQDAMKRVLSGKFTLEDMVQVLSSMDRGVFGRIKGMLGLGPKLPEDFEKIAEEKVKRRRYILDSMKEEEKKDPKKISRRRIREIAIGSGTSEKDVRELISSYKKLKKLVKKAKRRKLPE